MADLTATQLADIRADLGDTITLAFTDLELQRIWVRANYDYTQLIIIAIRQLLMNAAKFYDYVSGFTRQEQEKTFQHLLKMYEVWSGVKFSEQQVNIVGLTVVPPDTWKDEPDA